jgi:DNA-binding CsgD family transcriptional regulator
LRDVEGMAFAAIAKKLGISVATVTRAYDYNHMPALVAAAANGKTPQRGRYKAPLRARRQTIAGLLKQKKRIREIAQLVGCHVNTVYRTRDAINRAS